MLDSDLMEAIIMAVVYAIIASKQTTQFYVQSVPDVNPVIIGSIVVGIIFLLLKQFRLF